MNRDDVSVDAWRAERVELARDTPGSWVATATGGVWFFADPDPRDVDIIAVAYGLGRRSRYSGQFDPSVGFYSVAEHSCLMAEHVRVNGMREAALEDLLEVLLHDAPEFILPDIATPIKNVMRPYWDPIEKVTQSAIIDALIPAREGVVISKVAIKEVDVRIRADERSALIREPALSASRGQDKLPWIDGAPRPLGVRLRMLDPTESSLEFLEDFVRLVRDVPPRDPANDVSRNPLLARAVRDAEAHLAEMRGQEPATGLTR